MIRHRPYLLNTLLVLIAFIFSVALGAVFIPRTVLRILALAWLLSTWIG
jgi:hypothetical protein